jgi:hypothetical protein
LLAPFEQSAADDSGATTSDAGKLVCGDDAYKFDGSAALSRFYLALESIAVRGPLGGDCGRWGVRRGRLKHEY